MLDDLTPGEIVAMVRAINCVPDGAMVMHENKLTMLHAHPDFVSLCAKISQSGKRDDVKTHIDRMSEDA